MVLLDCKVFPDRQVLRVVVKVGLELRAPKALGVTLVHPDPRELMASLEIQDHEDKLALKEDKAFPDVPDLKASLAKRAKKENRARLVYQVHKVHEDSLERPVLKVFAEKLVNQV